MSDQIVTKGGGWRPPSNVREFLAAAAALAITLAAIQVASPFARQLTFIEDTIRDKVVGTLFGLYFPIERGINRVLVAARGAGGAPERPDLSPWFVTGLTAAAVLFAWNELVGVLTGQAIAQTLRLLKVAHENIGPAVQQGAIIAIIPLCAVASIFAGIALNRTTRSAVALALLLAAVGYVALNMTLAAMTSSAAFLASVRENGAAVAVAGVVLALVVLVFGGIGVGISALRGERSIGELVAVVRKLSPEARNMMTRDALDHIRRS